MPSLFTLTPNLSDAPYEFGKLTHKKLLLDGSWEISVGETIVWDRNHRVGPKPSCGTEFSSVLHRTNQ